MITDKFQSYFMSKTEFDALTDYKANPGVVDGDELQVIDESTTPHTVVGYYVAFNGYWCNR